MKFIERLHIGALALCMAFMLASCSEEADTTLTSQQKAIENYLTKSHKPALIEEYLVSESTEEQPPFYTHWALNIFRYISTYYEEGRESWQVIEKGTTFDIRYTAYIFASSPGAMFATNVEENIEEIYGQYPDEENVWSSEPMRITLGETPLMSGLTTALEGCRIGDKVEVYLTYVAAYGKQHIGFVPSKSAVMWEIEIVEAK